MVNIISDFFAFIMDAYSNFLFFVFILVKTLLEGLGIKFNYTERSFDVVRK